MSMQEQQTRLSLTERSPQSYDGMCINSNNCCEAQKVFSLVGPFTVAQNQLWYGINENGICIFLLV